MGPQGSKDLYDLDAYDYYLPRELIAYEPLRGREDRLLVVDRDSGVFRDRKVGDLLEYINEDVVVVFNDTKVIPARLLGRKVRSGGQVDALLMHPEDGDGWVWKALVKPKQRLKEGEEIVFEDRLRGYYHPPDLIRFERPVDIPLLEEIGRMPLPPYIKRVPEDRDRQMYQTVYARRYGAIAAPTAGLHFTPEMLEELKARAGKVVFITLHVGYGTFAPIKTQDIREYRIHSEWVEVGREAMAELVEARRSGKKILAIGTTVVRTLETVAEFVEKGEVKDFSGWTDIYIYPGYRFRMVDMLFTNFHLPRSSLLLLVCAFAGRDLVLRAYRHAVEKGYRFFSYGSAMLII